MLTQVAEVPRAKNQRKKRIKLPSENEAENKNQVRQVRDKRGPIVRLATSTSVRGALSR